jgi:small subunit ribosomal protein S9
MEKKDIVGIGRRKTSTARVFLTEGTGKILINSRDLLEYLQQSPVKVSSVKSPLSILGLDTKYDIKINIKGGGLSSQAGAIRLGLSRALCIMNPENRIILKAAGFMERDAREKERRKYGLKKARKAPQFSKR